MQVPARSERIPSFAARLRSWRPTNVPWKLAAAELLGTVIVMLVYFLVRGARPDDTEAAVARSLQVIQFEQQVGLFREVRLQEVFLQHQPLMDLANLIYAWGHFPVMLAIAVWLAFKDPHRFRFVRSVLLVSAVLGIATYYLLPAAPPRLMAIHGYDFGFIDTVHSATSEAHYFQPGPVVNDYAALPSFHFGWIALSSAVIWHNTRRRWLKAAAVAMSVVMWWAVTVTANHYFFDMAFGGAVVGVSWLLVTGMVRAGLPMRWRRFIGGSMAD